MGIDNLVKQLVDIYEQETWHTEKLSYEEALIYHENIIRNGNCITVSDGQNLVGYCEFYIREGVCFVANLFIKPEYRNKRVIWMMYRRLMEATKTKIYVGDRNKFKAKYMEYQLRSKHGKQ